MKSLSIIVPIYNVEGYISKCLDSILDQDIPTSEYEIILINDGSTDSSLEIAETYADRNDNIKLITQKNIGIGAARNVGIRVAKGTYILFVDSDDYLVSNCLKDLIFYIESENLDLLRFNYEKLDDKGKIIPKTKNSIHNIKYNEHIVNGETFLTEYLGWSCYVWLFLYNSSFIKYNNLYFNETTYFEDVDWIIRVLSFAKRVQAIDKRIYLYVLRPGSVTQSIQLDKKNKIVTDKIFLIKYLKQFSQITHNNRVSSWCLGMISLTLMGILSYVENELPHRKKEIIHFINIYKLLPLSSYHFTIKQKRDLLIININPLIYCYLKRRRSKIYWSKLIQLWS